MQGSASLAMNPQRFSPKTDMGPKRSRIDEPGNAGYFSHPNTAPQLFRSPLRRPKPSTLEEYATIAREKSSAQKQLEDENERLQKALDITKEALRSAKVRPHSKLALLFF